MKIKELLKFFFLLQLLRSSSSPVPLSNIYGMIRLNAFNMSYLKTLASVLYATASFGFSKDFVAPPPPNLITSCVY
jgi:hypothetical protein